MECAIIAESDWDDITLAREAEHKVNEFLRNIEGCTIISFTTSSSCSAVMEPGEGVSIRYYYTATILYTRPIPIG